MHMDRHSFSSSFQHLCHSLIYSLACTWMWCKWRLRQQHNCSCIFLSFIYAEKKLKSIQNSMKREEKQRTHYFSLCIYTLLIVLKFQWVELTFKIYIYKFNQHKFKKTLVGFRSDEWCPLHLLVCAWVLDPTKYKCK